MHLGQLDNRSKKNQKTRCMRVRLGSNVFQRIQDDRSKLSRSRNYFELQSISFFARFGEMRDINLLSALNDRLQQND